MGVPWHVGSLEKPTFSWPKGPPLQENSPKEGTFLVDPERFHGTRFGSNLYSGVFKGLIVTGDFIVFGVDFSLEIVGAIV